MAKSGGAKKERGPKPGEDLVRNRKAGYEYEILETLEAGMVLTGTEVKSLRDKKASLAESYVRIDQGEIFWIKGTIEEYSFGNVHNHASQRKRKLLLRKSEIRKLLAKVREKGLTLIPLGIYSNSRALLKMRIGLVRGKRLFDKRQAEKKKEARREIRRSAE
ncbi:MAG: SsrA-binding protein [Planctomycetota bacterium]|nr:MAG: SsrA-binding protein [Planctomycetota bacterium]